MGEVQDLLQAKQKLTGSISYNHKLDVHFHTKPLSKQPLTIIPEI